MADETLNVEATQPTVEAVATESIESTTAPEAAPTTDATSKENAEVEGVKSEETKAEEIKPEETKAVETKNGDAEDTGMLKTKARVDYNHRKNNKFDPSTLPETDNPSEIRAQVEFYFSDNNLPKDEFLWKLTGGSENKPVEIAKIHNFKRMRRFQPYAAVVKALRDSHILNVTGEEGQETVSRKHAYDPTTARKLMPCSVYVKGFGDEQPSTQFDIEAFFAKFDTVNAIRLRRTPEQLFKGSVFAEFDTEEQAKAFLALDPPPKWKGHELKIMSKQAYVDEKQQLIKEGKLQPSERRGFFEGRESSRGRGRGGRGGRGGKHFNNRSDADDWKARKAEDRKNGWKGGRGRGRGRGGRGGRGGHDRRDNRDENRKDRKDDESKPEKRAREDDGTAEPPAKKVDTKSEAAVQAAE